jgi:hypothetical protein
VVADPGVDDNDEAIARLRAVAHADASRALAGECTALRDTVTSTLRDQTVCDDGAECSWVSSCSAHSTVSGQLSVARLTDGSSHRTDIETIECAHCII